MLPSTVFDAANRFQKTVDRISPEQITKLQHLRLWEKYYYPCMAPFWELPPGHTLKIQDFQYEYFKTIYIDLGFDPNEELNTDTVVEKIQAIRTELLASGLDLISLEGFDAPAAGLVKLESVYRKRLLSFLGATGAASTGLATYCLDRFMPSGSKITPAICAGIAISLFAYSRGYLDSVLPESMQTSIKFSHLALEERDQIMATRADISLANRVESADTMLVIVGKLHIRGMMNQLMKNTCYKEISLDQL